jgi:hypothetical protein
VFKGFSLRGLDLYKPAGSVELRSDARVLSYLNLTHCKPILLVNRLRSMAEIEDCFDSNSITSCSISRTWLARSLRSIRRA